MNKSSLTFVITLVMLAVVAFFVSNVVGDTVSSSGNVYVNGKPAGIDTSGNWTGTLDLEKAAAFHDASQLTNQYRTLTWIVQDPTNSIVWPQFHPADGDGNWTIAEVSCWVNGGAVTGLCSWVVGDVPITTSGTSVESGVILNGTRTVDGSLSGFTTISNDQAIGFYVTELSEFNATNVICATVRLTK